MGAFLLARRTSGSQPGTDVRAIAARRGSARRGGRSAAVGVAEGVEVGPGGFMPAATAARFMLSATHWRDMSSMGWLRSLEWKEARSARLSTKSAGIGTSRLFRALLLGASSRTLMTGGP